LPFEKADNPVMSVVAFLAGAVSPAVAADAAQVALGASISTDKDMADETVTKAEDGATANGAASGKGVPPATAAKLALNASARSAARLASVEEQQIAAGIKKLVSLTLRKVRYATSI
jgi:SWI/SNF related-matrix-associated actin-dependent regulator of chromatin subfamily C